MDACINVKHEKAQKSDLHKAIVYKITAIIITQRKVIVLVFKVTEISP